MCDPRALTFKKLSQCTQSNARVALLTLPHGAVDTPVFMPVGTQGTMKGMLPEQLKDNDCQIILANTYHLGNRPGVDILKKVGGLHKYMNWDKPLLTDSGGFQMVSLLKLAEITENGVKFQSPYDESECMLTPEHSIEIQNIIGADIIMQLDDVVSSTVTGPRVEEAMHRTIRWLDRCLKAHKRPSEQNIFPIVQGGLDADLRKRCVEELLKREVNGYAVGGLSGGESKDKFWRMVQVSASLLPDNKPRYLMGVGVPEDLVVCVALGIDMFDCVFPTRTARFGNALVDEGSLALKKSKYSNEAFPISSDCRCNTCKRYTRAFLHTIVTQETVGAHLLTEHNIHYQMQLMRRIRESIKEKRFPAFVQNYMKIRFANEDIPRWIIDALEAVNIHV